MVFGQIQPLGWSVCEVGELFGGGGLVLAGGLAQVSDEAPGFVQGGFVVGGVDALRVVEAAVEDSGGGVGGLDEFVPAAGSGRVRLTALISPLRLWGGLGVVRGSGWRPGRPGPRRPT